MKLVEVLVVITICCVLIGLIFPAGYHHRQCGGQITSCQNNLKQIAFALQNYHDVHGRFPCGTVNVAGLPPADRLSWMAALLPYLEEDQVFKQIALDEPWNGVQNSRVAECEIKVLLCPSVFFSDGTYKVQASYVGMAGIGPSAFEAPVGSPMAGLFGYDRLVSIKDVTDGTSCTIAAIETGFMNDLWITGGLPTMRLVDMDHPPYIRKSGQFGRFHSEKDPSSIIANTALVDGSVRRLNSNIESKVFEALATIAGGEKIGADDY